MTVVLPTGNHYRPHQLLKTKAMKKPPDVIYIGNTKESPLLKWVNLNNWAVYNNDKYLQERAYQMILKLLK